MDTSLNGPEKATFPERLVVALKIPYIIGSLILTIICGPFGATLIAYSQTRNINESIGKTIILFFATPVPFQSGVFSLFLLSIAFFYAIYMIRQTRLRLLEAKVSLLPLLPKGEETFQRCFGRVCHTWPPIALSLIVIVIIVFLNPPNTVIEDSYLAYSTDPVSSAFVILVLPLWLIVFSTFAWVYFSSIIGLREMGITPLKMKSFIEDRMLGMRPIGSLSLSLAFIYFIGLGLLSLASVVSNEVLTSSVFLRLMVFLILLGVFLFFLPLNAFHKQMLEVKRVEQEALRKRLFKSFRTQEEGDRKQKSSTIEDMRQELFRLSETLTLTTTEKEVLSISTWPFDLSILSRLGAMVFSILTLIVGNLILLWIKNKILKISI